MGHSKIIGIAVRYYVSLLKLKGVPKMFWNKNVVTSIKYPQNDSLAGDHLKQNPKQFGTSIFLYPLHQLIGVSPKKCNKLVLKKFIKLYS